MLRKFVSSSVFDIKELEHREFEEDDEVYGEPFVIVCNESYLEFSFVLYPKGAVDTITEKRSEGVILGLKSLNEGKKIEVSYKQSVEKKDGSAFCFQDWVKDVEFDGTFTRYCGTSIASSLGDPKMKDLLQDDGSSLRLVMEMKIDRRYFSDESALQEEMDFLGYEHIKLFKQDYDLLSKGQSKDTDYTVACNESDKTFSCHKYITRRRSPYFENLLSSHPDYDQQDVHKVGWSPEVTEEVLYFIYNDEASPKFDSVPLEDLVKVAGMLELKKLLLICEKSLLAKINKSNAWDYLSIADTHEMKYLKKKALCMVSNEAELAERLFDQRIKEELRKEVVEFLVKRGRAQLLVQ